MPSLAPSSTAADMGKPKAKVYQSKADGSWRFRVVAGNGETLAPSEAYTRKADAIRGAKDLIANVSAEMTVNIEGEDD